MTASRSRLPRMIQDVALGAWLTATGGRDGWVRTAMTALGVGIGVAVLLLAISAPGAMAIRQERVDQRAADTAGNSAVAGPHSLLIGNVDTTFRGQRVSGFVVRVEGAQPAVPPGMDRLPAVGEAVVSPALRQLLDSPDGALIAPRIPYRVVATIGQAGLSGPSELRWYAVTDKLAESAASRIDRFGTPHMEQESNPVLILLLIVIAVVTLLPVAVFLTSAVRFGSDQRDRRLAALRLLGADRAMTRRVAAGEAVFSAVPGVVVGAGLFLAGRRLAELFTIYDGSLFATDIRPDPVLALLVVVAVVGLAVGVTLLSLRSVVIEPLGVVRRSGRGRGRLWWRLVPPAVGAILLYPLAGTVGRTGRLDETQRIAAGVVALLIGVAVLLPWMVETVVARLRGGPVAWQLAARRLQLHSGSSGRVVNGIAVAVAGAIAVQMMFNTVEPDYTSAAYALTTPYDTSIAVANGERGRLVEKLRAEPGVEDVSVQHRLSRMSVGSGLGWGTEVLVAACTDLLRIPGVTTCREGAVYRTQSSAPDPARGAAMTLPGDRTWSVPEIAGTMSGITLNNNEAVPGLIVTSTAIPAGLLRDDRPIVHVRLGADRSDVLERVRNIAFSVDRDSYVEDLTVLQMNGQFAGVRRALLVGSLVTLLLIGLSLLVGIGEQLRERHRALAVLAAFGTRRGTLGWSVLWQTSLPVFVGLALAVPAGIGLGALLLSMISRDLYVDPTMVAELTGAAAAVIVGVTVCSLPVLWRLMRAEGLRTE